MTTTIVGLAIAYALYRAITLAWVNDDAFISFRYAQNLISGHGLVYNIGERIEAYTNFLWTIIVAAGMYFGAEPILFSQILSIGCYLGTMIIFGLLALRLTDKTRLIIPLTMLCLAVSYDVQVYATSGLETSLAMFLLSLGFYFLVVREGIKGSTLGSFFLILGVMTRPDLAMVYIAGGLFIFVLPGDRLRRILGYLSPAVLVYLPYWLWRFSYYGFPFPNSYYAKSGGLSWYEQGLTYVWLYFKTYYALILVPILLVAAFWLVFRRKVWADKPRIADRALLLSALFILFDLFYIIRVGGDYMFARFLIPITPILFFLIERTIAKLRTRDLIKVGIAVLVIAATLFRWNQFDPPELRIDGITDERINYPFEKVVEAEKEGAILKRYISDRNVSVAFYGMKAMLVYYSEVPYALEAAASLNDTLIAHLPIDMRGRPGHEKRMPYNYLVERGINFVLGGTLDRKPDPTIPGVISFDGIIAQIVVYENSLMEELKQYPEVRFVDFPSFLDSYIERARGMNPDAVRADLAYFKNYYFDHNQDPDRAKALLQLLNR